MFGLILLVSINVIHFWVCLFGFVVLVVCFWFWWCALILLVCVGVVGANLLCCFEFVFAICLDVVGVLPFFWCVLIYLNWVGFVLVVRRC